MSPHDLKVELQSEQDINNYIKRVSGLNRAGKLVELANVRAAKYNLMSMPSGLNEFDKNQALVTDLTDKTVLICMLAFGRAAVLEYNDGDLSSFNDLVDQIDEQVASLNLYPEQHGDKILEILSHHLNT
jgi:hypothetical protein